MDLFNNRFICSAHPNGRQQGNSALRRRRFTKLTPVQVSANSDGLLVPESREEEP
jgi:hypothetical protein